MINYSEIENINKLFLTLEIKNLYVSHDKYVNFPLVIDKYSSNNDNNEIKYLIQSQNQNLLIIQEMGLAFFLSNYLIKKLPFYHVLLDNNKNFNVDYFFINNISYTKDINIGEDSGCKVTVITGQWNINLWSINKIKQLHLWLPYLGENNIPSHIEKNIDYNFIEALGYNIEILENNIESLENNINE